MFVFFFSSRRRHTRLRRDWSSDVCSSDLFDKPQQFSTGMVHVFVNGTQVLKDGEHTGELPGQVVKGPGWKADE